ncbi:MAG: Protein GrpE [Gammaproteobacteria bacterium]|nr:Protein GrpE [Gammaproteobacteria bacterium]
MSSKSESAEMQKDAMTAEAVADEMASPDDGIEISAGPEPAGVEELMQKLETLQVKADGYLNDLMRARAEAENVRKRSARDVENAHKYGQEKFIVEMLPVKDSMDLGVAAAESATDIESLREGMALTRKAFAQAMEKLGVVEVDPLGEKFNPELHEAISVQPADAEPNTVVTVVQKGYCLHDRLIRPALVIVAGSRN